MMPLEAELGQLISSIWWTMLGMEVEPVPPGGATGEKVVALTGRIPISGGWEGAVVVTCPEPLARHMAARIFGLPHHETSLEQIRDALREVVNMIGGNLKVLLPGPSFLGLPTVSWKTGPVPPSAADRLLLQADYQCQGMQFLVSLWETCRAAGREPDAEARGQG